MSTLYNYFNKLGIITYDDQLVNNIISSVRFKDIVLKTQAAFYPYTIKEGERADTIAANYYDDARYTWLVYLSNKIMDPYYEWPLSQYDFQKYLIKKYGTIAEAADKVAFYKVNWESDDSLLTPSGYAALSTDLKKYWAPVVGVQGTVVNYERKELDWVVETNQVVSVTVSSVDGYQLDEKVTQKQNGVVAAIGTIKAIDSTNNRLTLFHITGTFKRWHFFIGTLIGSKSNTSRNVSAVTTVKNSIPTAEAAYWVEVNQHTYEDDLNESKKHIQLIDKSLVNEIEDQMLSVLSA